MTLRLTPDILRACYAFVSECPPFDKWNLPDASDITFKVTRDPTAYGHYQQIGCDHIIAVSSRTVGHTITLVKTIAHELVHLHQSLHGLDTEHDAAFKKWGDLVCKIHGFDPNEF
jgi:hypothetical protein